MGTEQVNQDKPIWNFSEECDLLTKAKMKALGINESFLQSNLSPQQISTSIALGYYRKKLKKLTGR